METFNHRDPGCFGGEYTRMSTTTNDGATGFALDTELLKPEAVAHQLQISVSKAKRMILAGEIESVRVGGNRRVRRKDLNSYIEGLSAC